MKVLGADPVFTEQYPQETGKTSAVPSSVRSAQWAGLCSPPDTALLQNFLMRNCIHSCVIWEQKFFLKAVRICSCNGSQTFVHFVDIDTDLLAFVIDRLSCPILFACLTRLVGHRKQCTSKIAPFERQGKRSTPFGFEAYFLNLSRLSMLTVLTVLFVTLFSPSLSALLPAVEVQKRCCACTHVWDSCPLQASTCSPSTGATLQPTMASNCPRVWPPYKFAGNPVTRQRLRNKNVFWTQKPSQFPSSWLPTEVSSKFDVSSHHKDAQIKTEIQKYLVFLCCLSKLHSLFSLSHVR